MKDETLVKFGKEIKKKRIDHDLSREKLGELAGLSRDIIGGIERGDRNPTVKYLVRIAKALGEKEIIIKV